MVTLVCALVGEKGRAFAVDVDENKLVDALKDAIAGKQKYEFAADILQLFRGKKSDGTWLDRDGAEAATLDGNGYPEGFLHMDPLLWIKNPKNFGENFEPNEGEIHVLVVVPEADQKQWDEQRTRKKARPVTNIEVGRMNLIAATLDIDSWQIGGMALSLLSSK
jgi:Crinkler effector protein N-terminal domain